MRANGDGPCGVTGIIRAPKPKYVLSISQAIWAHRNAWGVYITPLDGPHSFELRSHDEDASELASPSTSFNTIPTGV
ncbi:hypothetical protein TNCV_4744401 [Trichonephila clavipes]|nr:hypothetical protein TNCV_4744401 [Trichonephila clavipes]